ncbi:oligosaccharide flippase family protein [Hyunsoonleella rubra]|uniref:Oligosaccharide flippase family protein n=1 Tax=Hyunsoonleella rubra TaxID=1737062 RepID=A0ABW5T6F8_9FLAO
MRFILINRIRKSPIFKNIAIFFSGSLIALIPVVAVQFFLPKFLSVGDYGLYKSFTLYLSYTSLLHFGLKDGIYIALCGEEVFETKKNHIYYSFLIGQQFMVLIAMLGVSLFFDFPLKVVLLCLAFTSFFFIINTYYDVLFQAQKRFNIVSLMKIIKETLFLVLLILIYLFYEEADFVTILMAFLASIVVSFIIYSYFSRSQIKVIGIGKPEIDFIKPVYNRGVKLIAGNFGHQINTNIDKLFINFFYSVELFAYYSFGGMFFVLTNTFVNSVATVLLPYLFDEYKRDLTKKHRQLMKVTTLFSLVLFFYLICIFHFVEYFYPKYIKSIPIIALFYIGMVYNIKINVIQNNYLKTLGLDKHYIKNNYIILLIFILVMVVLYALGVEVIYFALCTSIMMYLRSKINLWSINTKLEDRRNYILDDLFIIALGAIVYLYADYLI